MLIELHVSEKSTLYEVLRTITKLDGTQTYQHVGYKIDSGFIFKDLEKLTQRFLKENPDYEPPVLETVHQQGTDDKVESISGRDGDI